MNDFAVLTNEGEYTVFEFNREKIRFSTSKRLEDIRKFWNGTTDIWWLKLSIKT